MDFVRTYDEIAPSPGLRPFLECYWWSEVRAPAECRHRHRVLPDGCVDVLFDLTDGARGLLVGAMTRALVVEAAGPQRLVAARFRPGGARRFFHPPLNEWTDRSIDLFDVWREDRALGERMAEAAFPEGAVRVLDTELHRRLRLAPEKDRELHIGLLRLWQAPALSVREAAEHLGLTRQHLTRRCKAATGLGPKQLQRIARLQRALAAARQGQDSWAHIALDSGYCDQAHLIGECRALTGLTPGRLLA